MAAIQPREAQDHQEDPALSREVLALVAILGLAGLFVLLLQRV